MRTNSVPLFFDCSDQTLKTLYVVAGEKELLMVCKGVSISRVVFVIAIALILVQCNGAPKPATESMQPEMTNLTIADSGGQVELKKGDVFEIALKENATTGYIWNVTQLEDEYLRLLLRSTADIRPNQVAGAPITLRWRFEALQPGETVLKMANYRTWEGLQNAVEKFEIRLIIKP